MAKKDFDKEDGVWRTVGGRRIFIRNGQSLSDAMKESGKFSRVAKNQELYKKTEKESKEIEEKLKGKEETTNKEKDDYEYNLYKKARENEDSIDPMTENSTDWEALDEKYRDRYAKEQDAKSREEKLKNIKTDAEKAYKNGIDKNDFAKENAKHGIDTDESAKAYDEAVEKRMKETNKEIENKENERISKEKTEIVGEKKQNSRDDIDDGILERFGEDYGYDDDDNLKNLKGQIDYMRNPNESIHRTAERLVEGGDFLIYNDDIKIWLDAHNIKYNDDNFFDKYKEVMADRIEKLYNGKEEKTTNNIMNDRLQQKAYQKYLKEHPNSEMKFEDFIKGKK